MASITGSTTDTFISELKKWSEGKDIIKSTSVSGANVTVLFGKHEFTFTCPKSVKEPYIVQSKYRAYPWLDDVNIYCLEKRPTASKLLNIMSKQISRVKDEPEPAPKNVVKLNDPVNIDRDLGFDLERYTKNRELEKLMSVSKGVIESQQKKSQLFEQHVVGKIIITEFMKIWDAGRGSHSPFTVDTVQNNIYHWKVKFSNFTNKELMKSLESLNAKFGYGYIEVDICFHDILYPNYPPIVKVMRPKLLNSLMHKISSTRMIQLDYWVPTRSMSFIINKLYTILNNHARILVETDLNDKSKYTSGSLLPIEAHLLDLASFVDIGESDDVDDAKYDRIFNPKETLEQRKQRSNSTVWKSGTGYGHSGAVQWDVSSYIKSLEERDKQAQVILNKIIMEVQNTRDPIIVYNTIQHSVLIKYVKSLLNGTTLLEIRKHGPLYQIIFNLIGNLVNEDAIYLFERLQDSKPDERSLYCIMNELNSMCTIAQKNYRRSTQSEANEDELVNTIINLFSMIKPCYDNYIEQHKIRQELKQVDEGKEKSEQEIYVKKMIELRDSDEDYKIVGTNYKYQKEFDSDKSTRLPRDVLKRINDEVLTFKSLPIFYDALIIARPDVNYQTAIRTLITGPAKTPYEGGCFIFDTYLHQNFPSNPPYVWFLNTGGKRMNPNLYEGGKVCLSILGTWGGDKGGENWNPLISTLNQVYESIQSQILIEQPFYNEPGYESRSDLQQSKLYNDNVRLYTMKHAMYDLINDPNKYPQFSDVIRSHFKLKKRRILATCEQWTLEAPEGLKSSYESTYALIKASIEKL
jgi:baculoviral IAP repeat-containing protein 6